MDESNDLLLRLIPERTAPLPGVRDVLEQLRQAGYVLALASAAVPPVIGARLGALGVRELFDVVVSGLEVPRAKPAPDIFFAAAQRLSVPNEACLVVEDSPNGLLAAQRAAWRARSCRRPRRPRIASTGAQLQTLRELLRLLLPAESAR